jgi:hypothetical protein
LATINRAWCPFRRLQGDRNVDTPCDDQCVLYVPTNKLQKNKRCSFTVLAVWALQQLKLPEQPQKPAD